MKYEIVKPEGAPEWFVPGIKCIVSNQNTFSVVVKTIVWYLQDTASIFGKHGKNVFIDSNGNYWQDARPIEVWAPQIGEPVAIFDDHNSYYVVMPFGLFSDDTARHCYSNVAKYDGQKDMRIEALKDAPRYKA